MKKKSTFFLFCLAISSFCAMSTLVSAQTSIGGISPDPSAMLDVQSNSKGVLFPRMPTTQRDAISAPATGLIIFNTETRCLEINLGTSSSPIWSSIKCAIICGAYVAPGEWKEFMCHNLGAITTADPFTPSWEINGDYYQWGRKMKAADGPSDGTLAGANEGPVAGWSTVTAPNGAWDDNVKTENDPCPSGFRVPTIAQWQGVHNNNLRTSIGTWYNFWNGHTEYGAGVKYGTALFLPAAGYRFDQDGALYYRGAEGDYASSNSTGTTQSIQFYFDINEDGNYNDFTRANGYSVRCIAE
jgi:uncharacterized protein (TIGR02145 family)